jgi:hypothetical protein
LELSIDGTHFCLLFTVVRDHSGDPKRRAPDDHCPCHRAHSQCPRCGISSPRIHSYDTRRPYDLPMGEDAVRLFLRARGCRCLNAACPTQTFAQRLPQVVPPAAQRTVRWTMVLRRLGPALGGEAGARLSAKLHVPTSLDTLLRLVR